MNIAESALIFACEKHQGQTRKFSGIPYILHPAEVAGIIATMTSDLEVIASGALHDVIEDCGVTRQELLERFGEKVLFLVTSESEDKLADRPPESTWRERKEASLDELRHATDRNVKILWLADKLSNMRSFYREYKINGVNVWERLHNKNIKDHAWYYTSVANCCEELKDEAAYKEYRELLDKTFGGAQ